MLFRLFGGTAASTTAAMVWLRWSSTSNCFVANNDDDDSTSALCAAERVVLEKHVHRAQLNHIDVDIGNGEFMSTLIAQRNIEIDKSNDKSNDKSDKKRTLILYSGWGSGKALWAPVLDDLCDHFDRVIAVDPLGFGLSSRPAFQRRRRFCDKDDDRDNAHRARDFFVHSFERWRQRSGLLDGDSEFSILGHSLGGFAVASWAIEFGEQARTDGFDRLLLAAPVGVAPWRWQADTPMRRILAFLAFDVGVTPQGLLRSARGYAPELWSRLGERAQYRELCPDAWQFLYHNQVAPPSGDVAFMSLLNRQGWALPLLDQLSSISVPTRIIYGEHDYVSPTFGPTAVKALSHPDSDFVVVHNIGHHMYYQRHAATQFVDSIVSFH